MSQKKAIQTGAAPEAIGPYSQAVLVGNILFVSGQLGIDPATGKLVDGGVQEQTRQALKNVQAIVEAATMTMKNVTQVQVFLADIADFAQVNEVYKTFFEPPYPARAAVQAAGLPKEARVEILAIAVK
jgi:2-iminobutanoate/2-iminopropanoate deaminase